MLGIPQDFHLALLTPLRFVTSHEVYNHICVLLNSRHFAYVTSLKTCIYTLTLPILLVEHIICSIRINRMTTRSHWKFRKCTTTNDLTLYSFSSLYIFLTWGWPTVAETRRQSNKTDTKTVAFWSTYRLPNLNWTFWKWDLVIRR